MNAPWDQPFMKVFVIPKLFLLPDQGNSSDTFGSIQVQFHKVSTYFTRSMLWVHLLWQILQFLVIFVTIIDLLTFHCIRLDCISYVRGFFIIVRNKKKMIFCIEMFKIEELGVIQTKKEEKGLSFYVHQRILEGL